MIELARHIERLLLTNDCVIVPGLGGFMTQYVTARRVSEENLFLPPYRMVGFNAQLNLNDGLLIQSYMQVYKIGYPETKQLVEQQVDELKQALSTEGHYELKGIGELVLNKCEQIEFNPYEAGVISPDLYGLGSFGIEELNEKEGVLPDTQKERERAKVVKLKTKPLHNKNKQQYTIQVNRNVVNYVVAAVAAAVFFCLFSTPIGHSGDTNITEAAISKGMVFGLPTIDQRKAEILSMTPVEKSDKGKNAIKVKVVASKEELPKQMTPYSPKELKKENSSKNPYAIVLASAISVKNAELMVEDLHKKGFTDARIYQSRSMTRVLYAGFESQKEAHTALNKLQKDEEFKDAWVMQVK